MAEEEKPKKKYDSYKKYQAERDKLFLYLPKGSKKAYRDMCDYYNKTFSEMVSDLLALKYAEYIIEKLQE